VGRSSADEARGGDDVSRGSVGIVSEAVTPVPATSRDCISPFAVKLTVVFAVAVLVGVNRTVTVAVAPAPTRVKGLPESMRKGAETEAAPVRVPLPIFFTVNVLVAELPIVTFPKLTVPVGATTDWPRATALETAEHALSFPPVYTAVTATL